MTIAVDVYEKRLSPDRKMLQVDNQTAQQECASQAPDVVEFNVTVNEVGISFDDILAEAQHHPAGSHEAALQEAAAALVTRELLLQEAAAVGIEYVPHNNDQGEQETPDESVISRLLDSAVTIPVATEEECLRIYRRQTSRFVSSTLYEVRHILLSPKDNENAGRASTLEQARNLISSIQASPDRFAELAAAYSSCPSRQVNGSVGQVTRAELAPEFGDALAGMEAGSIYPEPVETRFGVHVIALDRIVPGEQLPFDIVKEQIANRLGAVAWTRAISQYIRILADKSTITGLSLDY